MSLAKAKAIGRKRCRLGRLWPMPIRETDLGLIYADVTVRPLAGSLAVFLTATQGSLRSRAWAAGVSGMGGVAEATAAERQRPYARRNTPLSLARAFGDLAPTRSFII